MNPSTMPQVAIPRSRWLQEYNHSFSMNHGQLIPLDCFEILPGDDYSVKKAVLEVIMSQPIKPIMGNIKAKVTAFFVPTRLVYQDTEEFYGANKRSAGPNTNTYTIPCVSIYSQGVPVGSVSHHLGKPVVTSDSTKANAGYGNVSILKERAYWLIWSEWYRAQQLQAPFILGTINTFGTSRIGSIGTTNLFTRDLPAQVCKQVDMYTSATLYPQYGSAVELPLGTYAPVVAEVTSLSGMGASTWNDLDGYNLNMRVSRTGTDTPAVGDLVNIDADTNDGTGVNQVGFKDIVADLSHATAAKINDIRYAFQLQKYLERANFGSRFFEVLAVHYGVTSPDARLQRPEYLGGKTAPIVVRTVLSTAGYNAGTSQQVGQLGASSITAIDISGLFSKGFVEPGYVMILLSTNHERSYSQGLLQEDTKFTRFEFYSPEFANLGDQEIKAKHLMLTGDSSDEGTFGFQGHWDEYRYRRNINSGYLDPAVSGSMNYWTLGDVYSTRPSLSASFIEENRDSITRCLASGSTGPDYICDYYAQYQCTREMPMYAIPGLVDHFGAL